MKTTFLLFLAILLAACSNNSKNVEPEEQSTVYIVTNQDEIGIYGKGTYLNSNSTYKSKDGLKWHRSDIFAPKEDETLEDVRNRYQSSYNDEYEEGYSDGYQDAEDGKRKRY